MNVLKIMVVISFTFGGTCAEEAVGCYFDKGLCIHVNPICLDTATLNITDFGWYTKPGCNATKETCQMCCSISLADNRINSLDISSKLFAKVYSPCHGKKSCDPFTNLEPPSLPDSQSIYLAISYLCTPVTTTTTTLQPTAATSPTNTVTIPIWVIYVVVFSIVGIVVIVALIFFCRWLAKKRQGSILPTVDAERERIVNDLNNEPADERPGFEKSVFDNFLASEQPKEIAKKPKKAVNCTKKKVRGPPSLVLSPGIKRLNDVIDSVKEEREIAEEEDEESAVEDAVSENTLNHMKETNISGVRSNDTVSRNESMVNKFRINEDVARRKPKAIIHPNKTPTDIVSSDKKKRRRHKMRVLQRTDKQHKTEEGIYESDTSPERFTSEEGDGTSSYDEIITDEEEASLDGLRKQKDREGMKKSQTHANPVVRSKSDRSQRDQLFRKNDKFERNKLARRKSTASLRNRDEVWPIAHYPELNTTDRFETIPLADNPWSYEKEKHTGNHCIASKPSDKESKSKRRKSLSHHDQTKLANSPKVDENPPSTALDNTDLEKQHDQDSKSKKMKKKKTLTEKIAHVPRHGPIATSSFKSPEDVSKPSISDKVRYPKADDLEYMPNKVNKNVSQDDIAVHKFSENFKEFEEAVVKRGKVNLNRSMSLSEIDKYVDEMQSRRRKRKYQSLRQARRATVFDVIQKLDSQPKKSILKKAHTFNTGSPRQQQQMLSISSKSTEEEEVVTVNQMKNNCKNSPPPENRQEQIFYLPHRPSAPKSFRNKSVITPKISSNSALTSDFEVDVSDEDWESNDRAYRRSKTPDPDKGKTYETNVAWTYRSKTPDLFVSHQARSTQTAEKKSNAENRSLEENDEAEKMPLDICQTKQYGFQANTMNTGEKEWESSDSSSDQTIGGFGRMSPIPKMKGNAKTASVVRKSNAPEYKTQFLKEENDQNRILETKQTRMRQRLNEYQDNRDSIVREVAEHSDLSPGSKQLLENVSKYHEKSASVSDNLIYSKEAFNNKFKMTERDILHFPDSRQQEVCIIRPKIHKEPAQIADDYESEIYSSSSDQEEGTVSFNTKHNQGAQLPKENESYRGNQKVYTFVYGADSCNYKEAYADKKSKHVESEGYNALNKHLTYDNVVHEVHNAFLTQTKIRVEQDCSYSPQTTVQSPASTKSLERPKTPPAGLETSVNMHKELVERPKTPVARTNTPVERPKARFERPRTQTERPVILDERQQKQEEQQNTRLERSTIPEESPKSPMKMPRIPDGRPKTPITSSDEKSKPVSVRPKTPDARLKTIENEQLTTPANRPQTPDESSEIPAKISKALVERPKSLTQDQWPNTSHEMLKTLLERPETPVDEAVDEAKTPFSTGQRLETAAAVVQGMPFQSNVSKFSLQLSANSPREVQDKTGHYYEQLSATEEIEAQATPKSEHACDKDNFNPSDDVNRDLSYSQYSIPRKVPYFEEHTYASDLYRVQTRSLNDTNNLIQPTISDPYRSAGINTSDQRNETSNFQPKQTVKRETSELPIPYMPPRGMLSGRNSDKHQMLNKTKLMSQRSQTPEPTKTVFKFDKKNITAGHRRSKTPTFQEGKSRKSTEESMLNTFISELKPKRQTSVRPQFKEAKHRDSFSRNMQQFEVEKSNFSFAPKHESSIQNTPTMLDDRPQQMKHDKQENKLMSGIPSEKPRPKSAMSLRSRTFKSNVDTIEIISPNAGNIDKKGKLVRNEFPRVSQSEHAKLASSALSRQAQIPKAAQYPKVHNKPSIRIPDAFNFEDSDSELEEFFTNPKAGVLYLDDGRKTPSRQSERSFAWNSEQAYSAYTIRNGLSKSNSFKV